MKQNPGSILDKLKKNYFDIKLTDQEVEESWNRLERRLKPALPSFPSFRYAVISLALVIMISSGIATLAGIVQAADTGSPLYPVKILSDKVIAKVTGRPEIKVERRAEDLIEAVKKEGGSSGDAGRRYEESLTETEKEVGQNEEKKARLQDSLNRQEESFRQAIKENPRAEEKLEKAIEKTQEVKENLNKEPGGAFGTKQEQKEERKEEKKKDGGNNKK